MNGNARLRILLNSLSLQPRHGVMILLLRIKPIKLTILNRAHAVTHAYIYIDVFFILLIHHVV